MLIALGLKANHDLLAAVNFKLIPDWTKFRCLICFYSLVILVFSMVMKRGRVAKVKLKIES